jgi:ABC-type sugar transport system permease subunit
MDMTTLKVEHRPETTGQLDMWVMVLTVWHALLAAGSVGAMIYLWSGANADMAPWVRILLTVGAVLVAAGSAFAAVLVFRRDRRGRLLSIAVNYLLFIATLVLLLATWGIFAGLDSLADTFIRGLPFLALIFLGWFVSSSLAERYENNPQWSHWLKLGGRVVVWLGAAGFFYAIGIFSGLSALASKYTDLRPILLTIFLILLGVMLWAMWRQPMAETMGATNADGEMLSGYLFLSPNLIGFLLFFAGPLLLSLYFSFTNWDAFGTRDWIGLDNYAKLLNLTAATLQSPDQLAREVLDVRIYDELTRFTVFGSSYVIGAEDKLFWLAMRNTLKYVLLVVPLAVIPALFLANLLNSKLGGMKFFRSAYFVPSIAAVVGIALVWQWLFNSQVGYINYFITSGIDFLNGLGLNLTDPQIRWLSDSRFALISVIIMAGWQMIGFNTVLFLAGLQQIPGELYEAATVDGAGSWRKFWNLTLPLLAPTTFFVLTTTVIRAMQVFEEIFILIPTNPAGPNNSTLSIVLYLYQKGFQRFEQGYASAIAWVLFLLIFGATLFQFQRQRRAGSTYAD